MGIFPVDVVVNAVAVLDERAVSSILFLAEHFERAAAKLRNQKGGPSRESLTRCRLLPERVDNIF